MRKGFGAALYRRNNSDRNTAAQAAHATGSSPIPRHAQNSAAAKPSHAVQTLPVAVRIEGNVITASVT